MSEGSAFKFKERPLGWSRRAFRLYLYERNELLAECKFIRTGKHAYISSISTKPRLKSLAEFKREFGVTPAGYLLERLVRSGVRSFSEKSLSTFSELMTTRFIKDGLVTKDIDNPKLFSVTAKLVDLADSRNVFVPNDRARAWRSRGLLHRLKGRLKRALVNIARRK